MKEEMRKRLSINNGNSSLFIFFLGYVGVFQYKYLVFAQCRKPTAGPSLFYSINFWPLNYMFLISNRSIQICEM